MAYVATNNAKSTLAAQLLAGGTTLTVAVGTGDKFPVVSGSDYTLVTLETPTDIEIVRVTGRALGADAMTVLRAQEGTTAIQWEVGTLVACRITAALVADAVNGAGVLSHAADSGDPHAAAGYIQSAELAAGLATRQPIDATLTALAGLATGANKVPYSTGTDTFGQLDFRNSGALGSSATALASESLVKAYVDGQDAATLAAANAYTDAEIAGFSGSGVGYGQSWVDVKTTPGRAANIEYTNDTAAPITVIIGSSSGAIQLTLNGVGPFNISQAANGNTLNSVTFVVPVGHTYKLTGANVVTWIELR